LRQKQLCGRGIIKVHDQEGILFEWVYGMDRNEQESRIPPNMVWFQRSSSPRRTLFLTFILGPLDGRCKLAFISVCIFQIWTRCAGRRRFLGKEIACLASDYQQSQHSAGWDEVSCSTPRVRRFFLSLQRANGSGVGSNIKQAAMHHPRVVHQNGTIYDLVTHIFYISAPVSATKASLQARNGYSGLLAEFSE
jgi:hypothetical protein